MLAAFDALLKRLEIDPCEHVTDANGDVDVGCVPCLRELVAAHRCEDATVIEGHKAATSGGCSLLFIGSPLNAPSASRLREPKLASAIGAAIDEHFARRKIKGRWRVQVTFTPDNE